MSHFLLKNQLVNHFAGSINGQGSLIYEAEKIGKDTLLSQIIKLVEDAQQTKAPIAKIADQVSAVFISRCHGHCLCFQVSSGTLSWDKPLPL